MGVGINYSVSVSCLYSSACRDGTILYNDVRKAEPVVGSSCYHKMEVCGLQWSPDGSKLASGANDNLVCIWNQPNLSQPTQILTGHQSAVKVSFSQIDSNLCDAHDIMNLPLVI